MKIKCPQCQTALARDGSSYRCPKCDFELQIEEDKLGELKERFQKLKASLAQFSLRDLKKTIQNRDSPATAMLIGFVAWGVSYFRRFPVFMAVLIGLSLFTGPWGIMLLVVLPLVYRAHRQAIDQQAQDISNDKGGSST